MLAQGAVAALVSYILEGQSISVAAVESPGDADSLQVSNGSVADEVKNLVHARHDGYKSEVDSAQPFSGFWVLGMIDGGVKVLVHSSVNAEIMDVDELSALPISAAHSREVTDIVEVRVGIVVNCLALYCFLREGRWHDDVEEGDAGTVEVQVPVERNHYSVELIVHEPNSTVRSSLDAFD
jgi:hypothetical protein